MTLAKRPDQYRGVRPKNPPNVITADRAPVDGTDKAYVQGDIWLDVDGLTSYQFVASGATWVALGTGAVGGVVTLTGDSGGPISPVGGNIDVLGAANQLVVAGTAGTLTVSLRNAVIAPGSLTTTTTLAATTTITAGTGITATTGNIVATAGAVNAGTTMTAGTGITATTGNIVATAGQVNAGTSMTAATTITATAGNITATLGNIVVNGAAKQFQCHGGAVTDFIGQATLANGTVTVANTNIATADKIMVTRRGINGSTALGVFNVAITNATSFSITALKTTDASTETNDTSIVDYVIIRQV